MNLGELRTATQTRGYATDTATAQTEMINSVYRRLCGEMHWRWLEQVDTSLSTAAGQANYSLSSITDLVHINTVRLQTATEYYDLEWADANTIMPALHIDRSQGIPSVWTYVDQSIQLYPRPAGVYTIVINYIYDPPDLSADSDTPVFPATYHDILVYGCVMDLAMRERDWSAFNAAQAQYEGRKGDMKRQLGIIQRQSPTTVISSGVWDKYGVPNYR